MTINYQKANGQWQGNTSHQQIKRIQAQSVCHTIGECVRGGGGCRFVDLSEVLPDSELDIVSEFDALDFLDDIESASVLPVSVYRGG